MKTPAEKAFAASENAVRTIIFDTHVELAKLYAQRGNDVARVRLRAWSISIDSDARVL